MQPPSPRRQQILGVAADLFREVGYHNVGMDDIADRVGLTGPALYRHFRGKQELLEAVISTVVDELVAAYRQDHSDLRGLLEAIAEVSVRRRSSIVLWLREASHLPDGSRRALRGRFRSSLEPLGAQIAALRPELGPEDVDLLVWGCQTLFGSTGYSPARVDPHRFQELLVGAALALCGTTGIEPLSSTTSQAPTRPGADLLPASRREAVLLEASRLFARRGYQGVSMDDIGAAAGIAGPSLYHHFPSKAAILDALLRRCMESMMFDLVGILDAADSADRALDMLVPSLVRKNIESWPVFTVLLDQIVNLRDEQRRSIEHAQEEYVQEVATLLRHRRPELTPPDAAVLVRGAFAVVALLSRRPLFRQRPDFARELTAMGRAALGLGS